MAAPCWAGQGLREVTARVPRACVGRTTRREGEGKQTKVPFPKVVFEARPSQALVLGWRPRSPQGLMSSRGSVVLFGAYVTKFYSQEALFYARRIWGAECEEMVFQQMI